MLILRDLLVGIQKQFVNTDKPVKMTVINPYYDVLFKIIAQHP